VIANPPYMGSKGMNADLKEFAKKNYSNSKSDLFAIFMERAFPLLSKYGFNAQINMQSWMFLSSYEQLRNNILNNHTIITMAHLGARAFSQISGEVVQTTAWIIQKEHLSQYQPTFFRLIDGKNEEEKQKALLNRENEFSATAQDEFKKIPGSPMAYWVAKKLFSLISTTKKLGDISEARMGLATGNNAKYVRLWQEVAKNEVGLKMPNRSEAKASGKRWFPYSKGGVFRKWYGNNEYVVDWYDDGRELQNTLHPDGKRIWAHNFNLDSIFKDSITWSDITSGKLSLRLNDEGFLFDGSGTSAFFDDQDKKISVLGFLNTTFANDFSKILNPTLHFQTGDFRSMPFPELMFGERTTVTINQLVEAHRYDWNTYERSWDFHSFPLLSNASEPTPTLESSYNTPIRQNQVTIDEMQRLEEENNRLFIDAYGLQGELTPEVPIEQITLTVNPAYRYGIKGTEQERNARFRSDTMAELVSYVIGCMMGRYSLDQEGLVYAHAGNEGFDASLYKTFPADGDGIVPILDDEWFKDDACNRVVEFVKTVWGEDNLTENLQFIAESLSLDAITARKSETSVETIRRYLSTKFYKEHMQTYKNRPIYWLFSSGKEKAFECLVYLHRYNEGTLSRMRTEYVTPLLGKYEAYAQQLDKQKEMAESTQDKKRFEKELKSINKKHSEIREFDDKLKHYADMRISIDLDDGVKANYGKFGDLLSDVKKITGKKPEVSM